MNDKNRGLGHSFQMENRCAQLGGEFGLSLFKRHFSAAEVEAILATLGTYSRGPRKGLIRGYVCWDKCVLGGWNYGSASNKYPHGVVRPGILGIAVSLNRTACSLNDSGNSYVFFPGTPLKPLYLGQLAGTVSSHPIIGFIEKKTNKKFDYHTGEYLA